MFSASEVLFLLLGMVLIYGLMTLRTAILNISAVNSKILSSLRRHEKDREMEAEWRVNAAKALYDEVTCVKEAVEELHPKRSSIGDDDGV